MNISVWHQQQKSSSSFNSCLSRREMFSRHVFGQQGILSSRHTLCSFSYSLETFSDSSSFIQSLTFQWTSSGFKNTKNSNTLNTITSTFPSCYYSKIVSIYLPHLIPSADHQKHKSFTCLPSTIWPPFSELRMLSQTTHDLFSALKYNSLPTHTTPVLKKAAVSAPFCGIPVLLSHPHHHHIRSPIH